MAGSRTIAEEILAQLQEVADARMRPMMGGWLLYVEEVHVGQINDDELFLKANPFADGFAPDLPRRSPYPGAKPALVVDAEHRADAARLHELLTGTAAALRAAPRPRRSR